MMRTASTRRGRTWLATAVAALLTTSLAPVNQAAAVQREPPDRQGVGASSQMAARLAANTFEKRVLRQVNKRRNAKELRRFRGNSCLDGYAEDWAQQIATTGLMVHQEMSVILLGCDLTWAGEALARGSSLTPGKRPG
jgi:uncharacterized protein YkwD